MNNSVDLPVPNSAMPSSRPLIAVYSQGGRWEEPMLAGIRACAYEHQVNTLLAFSNFGQSTWNFSSLNIAHYYNLDTLDGIITILDHEQVDHFAEALRRRRRRLPAVNIGSPAEGIPDVLVDNRHSMRQMVTHLITQHHAQRFAFLRGTRGHTEADLRYRVFLDTLQEHDLPFDEVNALFGDFATEISARQIDELTDAQLQALDAIVCANDFSAIGVISALQARHIRVPEDIAVTGFDDARTQWITSRIPLTTVHQPFTALGYSAMELLLAQLQGRQVAQETLLPGALVIRHSCGCQASRALRHPTYAFNGIHTASPHIVAPETADLAEFLVSIGFPAASTADRLRQLAEDISRELSGGPTGIVLPHLEHLCEQMAEVDGNLSDVSRTLDLLFDRIADQQLTEAQNRQCETFRRQTSRLLLEISEQHRLMIDHQLFLRSFEAIVIQRRFSTLTAIAQIHDHLVSILTLTDFQDFWEYRRIDLHMDTWCIALYDDLGKPSARYRIISAADQGRLMPPSDFADRVFSDERALPFDVLRPDASHTLVVIPITYLEERYGLAYFQAGLRNEIYELLANALASAMRHLALLSLVKQLADVDERHIAHDNLDISHVLQIIEWLEGNFRQPITVQALAERACLTHNRFTDLFHRVTGMTPKAYLLRHRLLYAANLLAHSHFNITTIAMESGFESLRAFNWGFQQQFGIPPSSYRRSHPLPSERFSLENKEKLPEKRG